MSKEKTEEIKAITDDNSSINQGTTSNTQQTSEAPKADIAKEEVDPADTKETISNEQQVEQPIEISKEDEMVLVLREIRDSLKNKNNQ